MYAINFWNYRGTNINGRKMAEKCGWTVNAFASVLALVDTTCNDGNKKRFNLFFVVSLFVSWCLDADTNASDSPPRMIVSLFWMFRTQNYINITCILMQPTKMQNGKQCNCNRLMVVASAKRAIEQKSDFLHLKSHWRWWCDIILNEAKRQFWPLTLRCISANKGETIYNNDINWRIHFSIRSRTNYILQNFNWIFSSFLLFLAKEFEWVTF